MWLLMAGGRGWMKGGGEWWGQGLSELLTPLRRSVATSRECGGLVDRELDMEPADRYRDMVREKTEEPLALGIPQQNRMIRKKWMTIQQETISKQQYNHHHYNHQQQHSSFYRYSILTLIIISLISSAVSSSANHQRGRSIPDVALEDSSDATGGETGIGGGENGVRGSRTRRSEPDHSTINNAGQEEFRRFTDSLRMKSRCDIPSISVAIVQDDKIVDAYAVGMADIARKVEANENTRYGIASLTKAFTATLLVKLLDRKKKTLDVKVKDILKERFLFKDYYLNDHVTIRDLLLHRTGIPRYDYLWISGASDAKAIFGRLKCMRLQEEFRTKPIYNNILYALAGHLAEVIGGESWKDLVQRELLNPLGMRSTTFNPDIYSYNTSRAHPYAWDQMNIELGDPLGRASKGITPALGMYSTARDMALWLRFHLSRGKNSKGHQIVPSHLMDEMHKGQVLAGDMLRPTVKYDNGSTVVSYNMYGLGWFDGTHRGHHVVMHYGTYPGFYSMITLVPEMKFGIFSTMNGGIVKMPYSVNAHIHTRAIDIALNVAEDKFVDGTLICPPPKPIPPFDCSTKRNSGFTIGSSRHLVKFLGTYSNPAYGNISVTVKNGSMLMVYNSLHFDAFPLNDRDFCIVPKSEDIKYLIFPSNMTFSKHDSRIINRIILPMVGFDNIFYKLSTDNLYEDLIKSMCGTPTQSCRNIEKQALVTSAAANLKNIEVPTLLIMLLIKLL